MHIVIHKKITSFVARAKCSVQTTKLQPVYLGRNTIQQPLIPYLSPGAYRYNKPYNTLRNS